MNLANRKLTQILVAAVLCFSALRGTAQDAKLQLSNLDKLSNKAARVTDVTLDGSLLQFAVNMIQKIDAEDKDVAQLQSIIKNLKGIYIKSFEFDDASQYSKADVDGIRSQLTSPRWSKIVQSIEKRRNEYDEIYVLKNGDKVGGVVILVAEARELTVVNLVGDVPMDKVASLERHLAPNEKQSGKNKQKKEKEQEKESGHDQE
jgi:vacuolar-type H+-ATPase subunit I/STV1